MPRLIPLLLALAVAIPANAAPMRTRAGAYELEVRADGRPVQRFSHRGETWLLGQLGERYTLRVINRSARPVEAVVSVDGRDVIDGGTASTQKGGYLVPAHGQVDIDGWRISHQQAAAFRFSRVAESYAAQMGSGREVGVIGVAIFEEKWHERDERWHEPPVSLRPRDESGPEENESCCLGARVDGAKATDDAQPADKSLGALGEGAQGDAPSAPASAMPPRAAPAPAQSGRAGSDEVASSESAPAPAAPDARGLEASGPALRERKRERPGLGTEYGETVESSIREVAFERASSRPAAILGARYDDRGGLIALGIDVDGMNEQALRNSAQPFPGVERSFAPPPPGWRP
jgi:hypothetical protein